MIKKKALGRGLNNMIEVASSSKEVSISDIQINPEQPRKYFDEEKLNELAESIKSVGVLQPIVVRAINSHLYEVISGERRYRASKIAGLKTIPTVIKQISKEDALKLSVIENIQREDLSPIELAEAYKNVKNDFKLSDADLAKEFGKNRTTIINTMRLLYLPEKTQNYLKEKKITEGQARPLITPYKDGKLNEELVNEITNTIIKKKLTSREVEHYVQILQKEQTTPIPKQSEQTQDNIEIEEIEKKLSNRLTSATKLKHNHKTGKGKIIIPYSNLKNMNNILKILGL